MSYDIVLAELPAGISVSAARAGDNISIQYFGTATSEDGERLVNYLGFASGILDVVATNGPISPSQVDHLLAIIRRDKTATVYVNELGIVSKIRLSKSIKAGEPVFTNDIVDIDELQFVGVEIPSDAGVIALFSSGWRKAVLFDFGPLDAREDERRTYNPWTVLGQLSCRLHFQERLGITNSDWQLLFDKRWFPFAGLPTESVGQLLGNLRAGWGVDDLLPAFRDLIVERADRFLESWRDEPTFSEHSTLLQRALERFRSEDYESCSALIFPRIEGVLRANHIRLGLVESRTQESLTAAAVSRLEDSPYSLLLPLRFKDYLQTVYFSDFDEKSGRVVFGRNSVGHGVARASDFNLESAIIGILTCHQLFYFFR